jgi:hypothetical protein
MRKYLRGVVVALLTFLGALAIGATAVLTSAITLAAYALIVPGTGTHNITTMMGYKENALSRYIAPADPSCTTTSNCNLVGINYPATFWPIPLPGWCPNLTCDTWNVSVGMGIQNLNATLLPLVTNPNNQVVLFGYSQGGAVVSQEMYNLANLPQSEKNQIQVVNDRQQRQPARAVGQDATFILIPDPGTMPLLQPFIDIGNATGTTALVKPLVDLLNPVLRVLVDLGYDRNANPGIPQTFQLFPIVNPVTLAVNLVVAVGRGIQAARNDITGDPPGGSTLAPTGPSTLPTFAPNVVQTPPITAKTSQPQVVSTSTHVPKPITAPRNGSPVSPFNLVRLPKTAGSNATPATPPKWKPGELFQSVTAPIRGAIDGLTKPNTGTSNAGSKAAA